MTLNQALNMPDEITPYERCNWCGEASWELQKTLEGKLCPFCLDTYVEQERENAWEKELQGNLNEAPTDILLTFMKEWPVATEGEGENITLLRNMFKIALDSKKTYE